MEEEKKEESLHERFLKQMRKDLPERSKSATPTKYIIPSYFFLYNILSGGDRFENIIEQQVLMADHGISFEYSDQMTDIEREIVLDRIMKREKDKTDFEIEKFKAYAKLLGAKFSSGG